MDKRSASTNSAEAEVVEAAKKPPYPPYLMPFVRSSELGKTSKLKTVTVQQCRRQLSEDCEADVVLLDSYIATKEAGCPKP